MDLGGRLATMAEKGAGTDVLHGLSGQLICSHLTNAELRVLSESSKHLRSLASNSVTSLAPSMQTRTGSSVVGALSKRFLYLNSLDLSKEQCSTSNSSISLKDAASFSRLQHLKVQKSPYLADVWLAELAKNRTLTSIDFRGCSKLTWGGLGQLHSLPNLRSLNCSGIKYNGEDANSDDALRQVLKQLDSLTMGDPCTLSWVDDRLMGVVGEHASNLTQLDCGGCIDMTDQGVASIKSLKQLRVLSLQSCVRLTNASLASVAELTNLQQLNSRGCLQVNEVGLKQLSTLTKLENLSLSCCVAIQALDASLLARLVGLKSLNLSSCTNLSSLAELSVLAKSLTELNISSCSKLKMESLACLSSLTSLTSLSMSGIRNQAKPAPGAEEGLHKLSSLTRMQDLRISRFQYPQGLPHGLLRGIAGMTGLRRLHMGGCSQEAPSESPAAEALSSVTEQAACAASRSQSLPVAFADMLRGSQTVDAAGLSASGAEEGSQLWFLEGLHGLRDLDLSSWRHGHAASLRSMSGLTQLTRLKLQRFGNDTLGVVGISISTTSSRSSSSSSSSSSSFGCHPVHEAVRRVQCPRPNLQLELDAPTLSYAPASNGSRSCLFSSESPADSATVLDSATAMDSAGSGASCSSSSAMSAAAAASCQCCKPSELCGLEGKMAAVGIQQQPQQQSSPLCDWTCALADDGMPTTSCSGADSSFRGTFSQGLCLEPVSSQQATYQGVGPQALSSCIQVCQCHEGEQLLGSCRTSLSQALVHLRGMSRLEELDLEACVALTDPGIAHLAHLGGLRQLNLAGCTKLRGSSLHTLSPEWQRQQATNVIAPGCAQLENLCLDDCPLVSDSVLPGIAMLKSLYSLSLKGCTDIGDAGLEALCSGLTRLDSLALYSAARVTSKGVAFLTCLPRLRSLQLPHCWNVDDEGVLELVKCQNLKYLNVQHCWRVSQAAVQVLQQGNAALRMP